MDSFNTKVSPDFDIFMQSSKAAKRNKRIHQESLPVNPKDRATNGHHFVPQEINKPPEMVATPVTSETFVKRFPAPTSKYLVTLKIKFETKFGQSLSVIGNIPELGAWKPVKAGAMTWTKGHVWVLKDLPIPAATSFFRYKYVVLNNGQPEQWEGGWDRIADLYLLHQEIHGNPNPDESFIEKEMAESRVGLTDIWESYTVNFSIYYPLKDDEFMRINGEGKELGSWNKGMGPLKMVHAKREIVWLTGMKVRPWEWSVLFNQNVCPKHICYKYSIRNDGKDDTVWEREPSRYVNIQEPSLYKGELGLAGSAQWKNVDKVFLVNGHIEKADANFVGSLTFNKIGDTNIFIGQYPQLEKDVELMHEAGVTGIFNVQTEIDHAHRGVNWPRMTEYYGERDMTPVHFPIHDFNESDLTSKLFDAAKVLNDMINNKGLKVYVHCTAGMGRAPACVLVYLCIFKRVSCWANPTEVDRLVKSYRHVSVPNMRAVYNAVEQNKGFQEKQPDGRYAE